MKLLPSVITLLLASSFLIVGCSEPSGKKATFPKPTSDKVDAKTVVLDLATRQKIFFLLVDAEQKASKQALALFAPLSSNDTTEFKEKLQELKETFYLDILKVKKLTQKEGEVILIEGIKSGWPDLTDSKSINKERILIHPPMTGSKTAPKKRPENVKTDK